MENDLLIIDLICKSDSKNFKFFILVIKINKILLVLAGYDRDVFFNLFLDI